MTATRAFVKHSSLSISRVSYQAANNGKVTITTQATTAYMIFSWNVSSNSSKLTLETVPDFMFYLGSTKKEYQPYGLSLTVNISNGSQSRAYNIPITALIEEGQTISKTTSGVDIQTYNGNNTITVVSENQPEKMKIKYQEPIS